MQHSSHAHPLLHGQHHQHEVPPAPAQSSYASPSPASFPSSPQGPLHQSPNPHGRRLQLRNARFTASSISPRRISPILGLVPGPIEPFSLLSDNEKSPPSIEKRSLYGETLPPSPVSILQEIQNSTRRKKTPSKGDFGLIFQDSLSMDENTRPVDDDERSWYEEGSNECTPSATRATSSVFALREGSLNPKGQPPLDSPLAKQTRGRARARSSLSTDNVEQSRYIEHLEYQLASAHAKIDGLTSPKTNKMRSVKLRSLTVENRNLIKDNSEWAKRAEEMVQEEKKRYASLELVVKSLEEDLEIKEARIAEFEWELEAMRAHVKDAEGLEEANANLEKKIDMLTGLLVNSPYKPEMRSAATSPKKLSAQVSPVKGRPRPISVLSRVPSSPNGARMSLATASEIAFWDSRSRSTSILETQEDSPPRDNRIEQGHSPSSDVDNVSPDSSKLFSFSDSYDDRRNSTSFTTRTGPSSRPSSFMSASSTGVPIWSVPLQHDGDPKNSNRQRKMRKFPSGSNTLKPLILPVASNANAQSLPASAPVYPSIDTVAYRDISEGSSIDPTVAFLTNFRDSSLFSTPSLPSRQRSTTLAREETLNALEGRRAESNVEEKEFDGATCVASGPSPEDESLFSGSQSHQRPRPQNLRKELEQADFEHAQLNALGISAADVSDEGLLSSISRSSSYQDPTHLAQRNTTPRARPKPIPTSQPKNDPHLKTRATNLFESSTDYPQSFFARITSLITQTKQDPSNLARRILANAWTLGCASLGGLGWWLIGPLHHHQRCRSLEGTLQPERHRAANEFFRGSSHIRYPWRHFSAEIRDGQLVYLGCSGDCERTWSKPNSRETCQCHSEPQFLSSRIRNKPHLFLCNECVEPSSRRSLRVWFQFSLTVVLAVGMAVRYGPGVLLAELSEDGHTTSCPRLGSEATQQEQDQEYDRMPCQDDGDETAKLDAAVNIRSVEASSLVDVKNKSHSAYNAIAFAEVLGPPNFEAG